MFLTNMEYDFISASIPSLSLLGPPEQLQLVVAVGGGVVRGSVVLSLEEDVVELSEEEVASYKFEFI